MKKLYLAGAAIVFAVAIVFMHGGQDISRADSRLHVAQESVTSTADKEVLSYAKRGEAELPYESQLPELPPSLTGVPFDHTLAVDEAGNLRISGDVRMVFDFFLTAIHEEPLELVVSRIEEYLKYHLQQPALGQARQLLARYIALKEALMHYEEEQAVYLKEVLERGTLEQESLDLLKNQLTARNSLRVEHLGVEAHQAFFEREEEYDRYTLERMRVLHEKDLSEQDKQKALDAIDSRAPMEIIASRRETQIIDTFAQREQALKTSGADQQDIDALRAEMFGTESVERFHELDQERAKWKERVASYIAARRQIMSHQGLSEEDRAQQINALKQSHFEPNEQLRLRAYERQDDLSLQKAS